MFSLTIFRGRIVRPWIVHFWIWQSIPGFANLSRSAKTILMHSVKSEGQDCIVINFCSRYISREGCTPFLELLPCTGSVRNQPVGHVISLDCAHYLSSLHQDIEFQRIKSSISNLLYNALVHSGSSINSTVILK